MTFPESVDWNKIQTHAQKPDQSIHDYYNKLQIVFKENSGLPLDAEITRVAFNFTYSWANLGSFPFS